MRDRQRLRWRLQCRGDDRGVIDPLGPAAARVIVQALESVCHEPVAPLDHRRARNPNRSRSGRGARAVSDREDHPRPLSMPGSDTRAARPRLKRRAILTGTLILESRGQPTLHLARLADLLWRNLAVAALLGAL